MGGVDSRMEDVLGRNEFAWWNYDTVSRAYQRALDMKPELGTENAKEAVGGVRVTRREFWDIFTDYTVLKGDTWLSLPLSVFSIFEDQDSGTVDVLEVFLMVALFSEGSMEEQLRFCFRAFDTDQSGAITLDEMVHFFKVLCRASFKVKIITAMPAQAQVVRIAKEMFEIADENGDEDISVEEFVGWCGTHVVSQRLLGSFKLVRKQAGKRVDKRKLRELSEEALNKAMKDGGAEKFSKLSEAAQTSRKVMDLLSQDVTFDVAELRALVSLFTDPSAEDNAADGGDGGAGGATVTMNPSGESQPTKKQRPSRSEFTLSRHAFCDVLCREYPSLPRLSAAQLFDSFDADGSGTIDLKEFTIGLVKVAVGTTPEKLELVFEALDADGDGDIGISELLALVQQGNDENMAITHFTSEIVHTLDKDGDGTISRQEFTTALAEQPVLYDVFAGRSMPQLESLKHPFNDLLERHELGMEHLADVWAKAVSGKGAGSKNREIALPAFRRFMQEHFHCEPGDMGLVNKLFLALDNDNSGNLDYQELFYGLSCVTRASKAVKADFYFSLYDADGSGEMDTDEIIQMVMNTQESMDRSAQDAVKMLNSLDEDGNGRVSLEEFQDAYKKSPELMECFGALFGTQDAPDSQNKLSSRRQVKIGEISKLLCGERAGSPQPRMRQMRHAARAANAPPESNTNIALRHAGLTKLRRQSLQTMCMVVSSLQASAKQITAVRKNMGGGGHGNGHGHPGRKNGGGGSGSGGGGASGEEGGEEGAVGLGLGFESLDVVRRNEEALRIATKEVQTVLRERVRGSRMNLKSAMERQRVEAKLANRLQLEEESARHAELVAASRAAVRKVADLASGVQGFQGHRGAATPNTSHHGSRAASPAGPATGASPRTPPPSALARHTSKLRSRAESAAARRRAGSSPSPTFMDSPSPTSPAPSVKFRTKSVTSPGVASACSGDSSDSEIDSEAISTALARIRSARHFSGPAQFVGSRSTKKGLKSPLARVSSRAALQRNLGPGRGRSQEGTTGGPATSSTEEGDTTGEAEAPAAAAAAAAGSLMHSPSIAQVRLSATASWRERASSLSDSFSSRVGGGLAVRHHPKASPLKTSVSLSPSAAARVHRASSKPQLVHRKPSKHQGVKLRHNHSSSSHSHSHTPSRGSHSHGHGHGHSHSRGHIHSRGHGHGHRHGHGRDDARRNGSHHPSPLHSSTPTGPSHARAQADAVQTTRRHTIASPSSRRGVKRTGSTGSTSSPGASGTAMKSVSSRKSITSLYSWSANQQTTKHQGRASPSPHQRASSSSSSRNGVFGGRAISSIDEETATPAGMLLADVTDSDIAWLVLPLNVEDQDGSSDEDDAPALPATSKRPTHAAPMHASTQQRRGHSSHSQRAAPRSTRRHAAASTSHLLSPASRRASNNRKPGRTGGYPSWHPAAHASFAEEEGVGGEGEEVSASRRRGASSLGWHQSSLRPVLKQYGMKSSHRVMGEGMAGSRATRSDAAAMNGTLSTPSRPMSRSRQVQALVASVATGQSSPSGHLVNAATCTSPSAAARRPATSGGMGMGVGVGIGMGGRHGGMTGFKGSTSHDRRQSAIPAGRSSTVSTLARRHLVSSHSKSRRRRGAPDVTIEDLLSGM